MKLYADPSSTTCRGILMFAADAGIPLETEWVGILAGEHRGERFAAINPCRLLPVLEDGAFRLTESSAILKYLADKTGADKTGADKTGTAAAYPAEPEAQARVNELMDWFNTGFYREFGYGLVYARVLREEYGWEEPAIQAAALGRAEARARRLLDLLDGHWLARSGGDGPFLGGAAPNLADYMGAAYVSTAELIGFDLAPWPRVARWMTAMAARPAWAQANAGLYAWRDFLRGTAAAATPAAAEAVG